MNDTDKVTMPNKFTMFHSGPTETAEKTAKKILEVIGRKGKPLPVCGVNR